MHDGTAGRDWVFHWSLPTCQQIAGRSRRVVAPPGRNTAGGWSECSPARLCCPAVTAAFQTPWVPGQVPGILVVMTDWLTREERAERDWSISCCIVQTGVSHLYYYYYYYYFFGQTQQHLPGLCNLQVLGFPITLTLSDNSKICVASRWIERIRPVWFTVKKKKIILFLVGKKSLCTENKLFWNCRATKRSLCFWD